MRGVSTYPEDRPRKKPIRESWDGNIYGLRKVGQGGTAFVFMLDDWTVVKVPIGSSVSLLAFEREREVYRRLRRSSRQCRNILTCYDTEISSGLVLEKCIESVRERLARMRRGDLAMIRGTEAMKQVIRWSYQASAGLAFLHDEGVIQADVGCHNMLLDYGDNLKLADFSGSIIDGADSQAMVDYDVRSKLPDLDEPNRISDLFALGSAIYEMATGYVPYRDLSPKQITSRFRKGIFPGMEDLRSRYPGLAEVIEGCWRQKFSNAHQLASHLKHYFPAICKACRTLDDTPDVDLGVGLRAYPRGEEASANAHQRQLHKPRHKKSTHRGRGSSSKQEHKPEPQPKRPSRGHKNRPLISMLLASLKLK